MDTDLNIQFQNVGAGVHDKVKSKLWSLTVFGFYISVVLPLVGFAILKLKFDSYQWVSESLHSALETSGALVALILGFFFALQRKYLKDERYLIWSSGALLCLGILEFTHALLGVSPGFFWARALATCLGGLLFSFVWLPKSFSQTKIVQSYSLAAAVFGILVGAALFNFNHSLPQMFLSDGTYLGAARWINVVGGVCFLAAAVFFIREYHSSHDFKPLLFANFCMLSGMAGLLFGGSKMWDGPWWMFHYFRTGAYFFVIFYFIVGYRKSLTDALRSNVDLEKSVARRTQELAIANQAMQTEIRERQITAENLRNSQEKLRATLEAMNEGVAVFDMNGSETFENLAQSRIYGNYSSAVVSPDLEAFNRIFELRDLQGNLLTLDQWPISRVLRGESLFGIELHVRRKDIEKDWYFHYSGEPIRNAHGEQIFALVVSRDITEMKRSEIALRENETKFRQLANSIPQIVWISAPDGKTEYCNRRWFEYTGLPSNEPLPDFWGAALYPSDLPKCQKLWAHSLQTGEPFEQECRLRSASDGEFRWHLGRALPIRNDEGKILKWVGTCTDVHEQKTLLQKIRESETRLNLAIAAAEIGTWDWDMVSGQIKSSPIHNKMIGLDLHMDCIPVQLLRSRLHPEDRRRLKLQLNEAIDQKKDFCGEFRIRRKNENFRWIYLRGRVYFDEQGLPVRMYGVSIDVTDRRENDKQLREALEHAKEANQLKSAFLANMSHEIRTPLGVILGFAEILQEPSLSPQEKENAFHIIQRNGEQLSHLINDILDLSKIEAGQIQVEILEVNLRKILEEVVSVLKPKAEEKNLLLSFEIEDSVPDTIGSDPVRLKQILFNIIGNAIKFTSKGSVRIQVGRNDDSIRIRVQDTGIGLTAQEVGKLFQPFSQADQTTTRKFGGTGLGLALSKKLALALEGDLKIVSAEPGKGSVFEVNFKNKNRSTRSA